MSSQPARAVVAPRDEDTANGRFKRGFGARLWSGMIAATVLHFAVFALWPSMAVADMDGAVKPPSMIELPPEVEIPEAPEEIVRPAKPMIGDAELDEDLTINSTRFEDYAPSDLAPPPPPDSADDVSSGPRFTPYTVAPRLLNPAEVERALVREYPSSLRDAGIGGKTTVHVHIGADGAVLDARIAESSGYGSLDRAALDVVRVMRFSAALNREAKVPVWVKQDITFVSREAPAV